MSEKVDIYSYFWDDNFGINFNRLEKIIKKEEISWRAKLIKLNKKKNKAKDKYVSWFRDEKEKVAFISLSEKYRFLKEILPECKKIPRFSCLIEITFTLKKPYFSKDDDNFYVIDNPIVKEKVFKLPMVKSTTWKGALRFAFRQVCNDKNIEKRLFGNEKRETKSLRQGRLFFYPTFFDNISLDVITPLDRRTKTPARGPIYFEIVPENTKGVFKLLYYPFDLIAKGEFNRIKNEAEEDFELLAKAIHKMFYEIGFSAKKTSGFGVAEVEEIKIKPGDKMHKTVEKTKDIFEGISEFKGKMKIE